MSSQIEPEPAGDDPPSPDPGHDFGDDQGIGFAPADEAGDYFNDLPQIRMDHDLRGMLMKHPGASSGHAMDIDLFKIQTKIDVHRIKSTLWSYMNPKLVVKAEDGPDAASSPAAERQDPDQDASLPNHGPQADHDKRLQMTDILCEMYGSGAID